MLVSLEYLVIRQTAMRRLAKQPVKHKALSTGQLISIVVINEDQIRTTNKHAQFIRRASGDSLAYLRSSARSEASVFLAHPNYLSNP